MPQSMRAHRLQRERKGISLSGEMQHAGGAEAGTQATGSAAFAVDFDHGKRRRACPVQTLRS